MVSYPYVLEEERPTDLLAYWLYYILDNFSKIC
jgi:hypothetical protein